ncbi:MAG: M55 family metallopeptidase [Deltaproteobacteria bacterium]|nr:M55 family metallopeptidase [Deltaproteobacteria bacterium]
MKKRVILLVDMESILGFDSLSALLVGTVAYERARLSLTKQVAHVSVLLEDAGWQVHVVDSHESGSGETNVLPSYEENGGKVHFLEDAFAALFDGTLPPFDAVAAWGMHAGALSPQGGFAAHTFALHTTFGVLTSEKSPNEATEDDFSAWSETEVLLALCEAHEVPVLFVGGSAALEDSLGDVPFVCTQSVNVDFDGSLVDEKIVFDEVRVLATRGPVLPHGFTTHSFCMRFKQAWMNRVDGELLLRLPSSIREAYAAGQEAMDASLDVLGEILNPDDDTFEDFALELLGRRFSPLANHATESESEPTLKMRCAKAADKALPSFLNLTTLPLLQNGEERSKEALHAAALRALVLLILQSKSAAFFSRHSLQDVLDEVLDALLAWPLPIDELDGDDLIAIADVFYLLESQGQARPLAVEVKRALRQGLKDILGEGDPLTPWLTDELLHDANVGFVLRSKRPFIEDPCFQVYVDSHVILLERRYGIERFDATKETASSSPSHEELVALERMRCSIPNLLAANAIDALAEIAFCTQLLGEFSCGLLEDMTGILLDAQLAEGRLEDHSYDEDGLADHVTGVALIVFALHLR